MTGPESGLTYDEFVTGWTATQNALEEAPGAYDPGTLEDEWNTSDAAALLVELGTTHPEHLTQMGGYDEVVTPRQVRGLVNALVITRGIEGRETPESRRAKWDARLRAITGQADTEEQ